MRMCACRGTAGFVHVSCLAEQAKILVAEAEENNLGAKVKGERFARWHACGLCEQHYHGAVCGALSWACWKTYLGRPETDQTRQFAMNVLGRGLFEVKQYEDVVPVYEAELSMARRLGESEHNILVLQSSLATTYYRLGRLDEALPLRRDVYFGFLKLYGEEHVNTLYEANNYAGSLMTLERFEEAKSLLRKAMPVARRTLGYDSIVTLTMRKLYAQALYEDTRATVDDLREAVTTLEETSRTARRVLGGAHPRVVEIEETLRDARAALRAREEASSLREAMAAMAPPRKSKY